jgi:hypothetical protein
MHVGLAWMWITLAAAGIHPMPLQLHIEGFIGPAPNLTALATWVVDVDGVQHQLTVTTLQPIGADVAYWHILNALEPLPIALTVFGSPELRRQFTSVAAGQLVAIDGSFELRHGPASLLLRKVEPLGTPVPLPTVAPTPSTP